MNTTKTKPCKCCQRPFRYEAKQRKYCDECVKYSNGRKRPASRHPDQLAAKAAYDKLYYQQHLRYRRNVKTAMLSGSKMRAKRIGVPHTITLDDIVIPICCSVFGTPLVIAERGFDDNSPSLDRFKPELGYVPGNIHVISYKANRLKSNATAEDLEAVLLYMRSEP